MRTRRAILTFCMISYIILCSLGNRVSENWSGGDFSLYLMHAQNILRLHPYADTDYVHNPANAIMSPAAYPPGFPATLVPFLIFAGLDFSVLKLNNVLFLAGLVVVVFSIARRVMGLPWALLTATATALLPGLFEARDHIGSDVPFTFWCYLALLLDERAGEKRGGIPWFLGAAVAMAYATRTAGLPLVGALLAGAFLRPDGRRGPVIATVLIGFVAAVILNHLLRADTGTYISYFGDIAPNQVIPWLIDFKRSYTEALRRTFGLGFGVRSDYTVLYALLAIAAWGWLLRARSGLTGLGLFVPFYAVMLLVFPVKLEPRRYVLPLAPALVFYLVIGCRDLFERVVRGRAAIGITAVVLSLCIAPYYWMSGVFSPLKYPINDVASQDMAFLIREKTSRSDIVLARNPRTLALLTGRRSATWPEHPSAEALWSYAKGIGANYILSEAEPLSGEAERVKGIITANPDRFHLVWRNEVFLLYRILLGPVGT